ncbi:MAG: DUF4920 domain-containing protein [Planctomycetes bacterium]|nr:DUF4920 domain-containing protein [Planctomycetota bacterium]
MRHLISAVLVAAFALPSLAQDPPKPPTKPSADRKMGLAKPLVFEKGKEVYGAPLKGLKHLRLKRIAKRQKKWNGKKLQIRGEITSVCPKKGCWMMVKEGAQTVRVRFTDYAFFVPLDCAKQRVTAEGTVTVKVETEAERRHYAEDAGKSKEEIEKITGDKVLLSFTADAVQIGKPPAKKKAKAGKGKGKQDDKTGKGDKGGKSGGQG